MSVVTGIITGPYRGEATAYKLISDYASSINITLPKDRIYRIGLDQSTSCTGMYIVATDGSCHVVLDFKRREEKLSYYRELKFFIRRLVKDLRVDLIVMEKPVPSKYKSAGNILREFKGKVEEWISDTPELQNAKLDSIFPQSWKTQIIDPSKGKNRFNIKAEVALDICDLLPQLKPYYYMSTADYDGFDAAGILLGYLKSTISETGNVKISGSKENSHHTVVFYKYLSTSEVYNQDILFQDLAIPKMNLGPKLLEFNNDYSLYENIKMCSSNNNFGITVLTRPIDMLTVLWEFGIQPKADHHVVLFILRKSKITPAQLRFIKERIKCYEEFQ